jgi:carbonic anhydrase
VRLSDASAVFVLGLLAAATGAQEQMPSADAVISELKAGNEHHVAKHYQHPHQTAARQRELASAQHPHAAILSCADSRVAPEIVFDQGLGDLFDVRVAGNIAGEAEIASVEYAAEHLNVPLLVVMGHQKCGALTAAAEAGEAHGHLPSLLAAIRPAIEKAAGLPGDRIDNAIRINVEKVVNQLRGSKPVLAELVEKQHLRIVGAVYSLDTGRVEWLAPANTASLRFPGAEVCSVLRHLQVRHRQIHVVTDADAVDPVGRFQLAGANDLRLVE